MAKAFRFSVVSAGTASPSAWRTLAQRVEELGYASLLMCDRALTALAVAATATTTLRAGSYVFANDYRHPLLAKEVATLDQPCNGHLEFRLGAGVGAADFQQPGLPFDAAGTRVALSEEAFSIIKAFFTAEVVNFSGNYYTFANLRSLPRPMQQPHPPIFIGSSRRRMLTHPGGARSRYHRPDTQTRSAGTRPDGCLTGAEYRLDTRGSRRAS
jgi:alkanesulfonate monooxygenase SsuD/methylene tetrahydromethanopterin reductase-like flavin-dependent oxidoreductase (luciferase family)